MFSRERSEKQYIAEYYEYFIETEKYQYCLTLESPAKHFHDSATEGGKNPLIIVCGGCGKNQRATGTTVNGKTGQQSETRQQDNYTAVKDKRAEQLYSSRRQ